MPADRALPAADSETPMPLFGSPDHSAQLDRIERKLDMLLSGVGLGVGSAASPSHIPAPGDHPRMAEVRALVAANRKIEAIKIYREITGLGLKEAKDAIDAM